MTCRGVSAYLQQVRGLLDAVPTKACPSLRAHPQSLGLTTAARMSC